MTGKKGMVSVPLKKARVEYQRYTDTERDFNINEF